MNILFLTLVPSSPKDIANLKNEIEKRQKEDGGESQPAAIEAAEAGSSDAAITDNGTAEAQTVPAKASVQVKS